MSAKEKTVLLAGATGLVGGHCLAELLALPGVDRVVTVGRRPPAIEDARVEPFVTEFPALGDAPVREARTALCALGTTIRRAGSQAAFREVDHDAVVAFARYALRSGAEEFGLISSVGASAHSSNFYLRVKGETEAAVGALGFRAFVVLRPSLLLGKRAESRPGEAISQRVYPIFTPLMFGRARRFRAIRAGSVAAALARLATEPPAPGRHVWYYDEILTVAGR